jgi:hypothetical protein
MNKKQMTVSEFAESIKHDYQTTSAFVKVLMGIGAAREVGKRPQAGGRGKPSTIYEFDQEIELALWENEVAPVVENVVDSPVNKE